MIFGRLRSAGAAFQLSYMGNVVMEDLTQFGTVKECTRLLESGGTTLWTEQTSLLRIILC